MASPATMTPMRATLPDDIREKLVEIVMTRDRLPRDRALRVIQVMNPADLTFLEMEAIDLRRPAFTADYDPFARG
jgi:hypothetical protein